MKINSVRLACVKHAASVHPEPGSNSLVKSLIPDQNQHPANSASVTVFEILHLFRFVLRISAFTFLKFF